jgi:hypothetical protein
VAACLGAGRTERRGEPRDEGRRHANARFVFAFFFGSSSSGISERRQAERANFGAVEMHPSVQQKALLWVPFLTDFFWRPKIYDKDWSVKKIYERIDDLSV